MKNIHISISEARRFLIHYHGLDGFNCFGKQLEQDRAKLHKIMYILDTIIQDEELYMMTSFGIEGEDWVWDEYNSEQYPKQLIQSKNFPSG